MRIVVFFLLVIVIESCDKLGLSDKPFSIKNIEIEKKLGDCNSKEGRCLNLKLKYPEIEEGSEILRNSVNLTIKNFLINSMVMGAGGTDGNVMTIDTAIIELEEEFRDFIDDLDFPTPNWSIESTVDVTFSDSTYFAISMHNYNYMGGAHPNYSVSKRIFNKESGQILKLTDLVTDVSAIKKLVETNFRKEVKVPVPISLSESGFWFENDKFTLPENIGMTNDGLEFYYNPYEVAPYAQGAIDIVLPFNKIQNLLK